MARDSVAFGTDHKALQREQIKGAEHIGTHWQSFDAQGRLMQNSKKPISISKYATNSISRNHCTALKHLNRLKYVAPAAPATRSVEASLLLSQFLPQLSRIQGFSGFSLFAETQRNPKNDRMTHLVSSTLYRQPLRLHSNRR